MVLFLHPPSKGGNLRSSERIHLNFPGEFFQESIDSCHITYNRKLKIYANLFRFSHLFTRIFARMNSGILDEFLTPPLVAEGRLLHSLPNSFWYTQGNYATQESSGMCHLMPRQHLPERGEEDEWAFVHWQLGLNHASSCN